MRDVIEESYRDGDIARAHELCRMAMVEDPDDIWIRHRAVLCLIKSGALDRAWALFKEFGLDQARDDEDCLSINARLNKARAFEADAQRMPALALGAADLYAGVFEQTGGHYPAINAASMYLAAGETGRARDWARRVLGMRQVADVAALGEDAYYRGASEAEAHLLLGDSNAARFSIGEAISRDPDNHLAQATTRRQLRWVSRRLGLAEDALSWPDLPRPLHYAGHLFGQDALSAEARLSLVQELDAFFDTYPNGPAFGALAAGADILVAEAVLRHGRPLHLVLPVPVSVFIETSIAPYGDDWLQRAHQVLEQAAEIIALTSDRRILSPTNLNFASNVAMGLVQMRAEVLATKPMQLLLCESGEEAGEFGTARDGGIWRQRGLDQHILDVKRSMASGAAPSAGADTEKTGDPPAFQTAMRGMLFVDVANSTIIPDDRVGVFVRAVLGALVTGLDQLEAQPLYRDSWGDGLFLAFSDARAAAGAATCLRQVFSSLDQDRLGMPESLELRIGAHFGPVHIGVDPLQKRPAPFGAQVAIASRIERAAVPGAIFTSEAFAAMLKMEDAAEFRCEYIGRRVIDRNMPELPLYALREIAPDSLDAVTLD